MTIPKTYISLALSFVAGLFAANYFNGCGNNASSIKIGGKKYDVVKVVRDTQYIKKDTIVYRKGADIINDTIIYVDVPAVIDTAQILKDFYSISVFSDTLRLDSGYVSVIDSISQNKILGRKYSSEIYSKSVSEKIYIKEPFKRTFFWGVGVGAGRGVYDASVNIFMETQSRRLYGIGAGLINGTPSIKGNVLIKL